LLLTEEESFGFVTTPFTVQQLTEVIQKEELLQQNMQTKSLGIFLLVVGNLFNQCPFLTNMNSFPALLLDFKINAHRNSFNMVPFASI
jgi:hypothetical protein